jgi:flagellar basal body rod protein FlgB
VITNNIANLSTPGFRPSDVSPQAFQRQLAEAVDARRAGASIGVVGEITGSADSALPMRSTRAVEVCGDRLIMHPEPTGDNILFHDGNDRSVERVMQGLVENFLAFRAAAQLMRSRIDIINTAIRERI